MNEFDVVGLRDPDPREPGVADRDAVASRARQLRARRRRRVVAVVVVSVTMTAGAVGAVVARNSEHDSEVVVAPTPTTRVASPALDARCFDLPTAPTGTAVGSVAPVQHAADGMPRLLVLARGGDLWVIDNGTATLWAGGSTADASHSAYVWARFAADGTIYASRVGLHDVEIDHLTAPGTAQPVATLPYTVKATAPAGYCPIDGYLASFGISSDGFVLLHHLAGPLPHSCPATVETTSTTDPWRCSSPDGVTIETRPTISKKGTTASLFLGGGEGKSPVPTLASQPTLHTVAVGTGGGVTVASVRQGDFCCAGGQLATAYALGVDGNGIAYASTGSGGRWLWNSTLDNVGVALWQSPDPIDRIAASAHRLAVAHGGAVTLIPLTGSDVSTLGGIPALGPVATLDWAP